MNNLTALHREATPTPTLRKLPTLYLLAAAELLAMAVWFSASTVAPQLAQEFHLSESSRAWLTISVQLGFVFGALTSAIFNLSDRLDAHILMASCAVSASAMTFAIVSLAQSFPQTLLLRFCTGVFLAQSLAFAGLHLRDRPLVQHHAADQLHVEMPHVEHTPSRLADHSKGLYQNLFEDFLDSFVLLFFKLLLLVKIGLVLGSRLGGLGLRTPGNVAQPLLNALPEFVRFGAQFGVAELLDLRLKRIDRLDLRHQRFDDPFVLGPKNLA